MIKAALNQGADGLAVSAPDIGAISGALAEAEAAGIPIVTLNSGSDLLEQMPNVITHVGQSERPCRGRRRPEARAEGGSKKVLCILHEENNIGLQERCAGAKEGMAESGGEVVQRPGDRQGRPEQHRPRDRRGDGTRSPPTPSSPSTPTSRWPRSRRSRPATRRWPRST